MASKVILYAEDHLKSMFRDCSTANASGFTISYRPILMMLVLKKRWNSLPM